MPPAVDAEPPPANISASDKSRVVASIWFWSTRLKPPERVMTEAKMECVILSPTLMLAIVRVLSHSIKAQRTEPATSRIRDT